MTTSRLLEDALEGELVAITGAGEEPVFYPHSEFIGAFSEAYIERLSAAVPQGASVRQTLRGISGLRTEEVHQATLDSAIRILREHGNQVAHEDVRRGRNRVVAVFPTRRSSRRIST